MSHSTASHDTPETVSRQPMTIQFGEKLELSNKHVILHTTCAIILSTGNPIKCRFRP